MINAIEWAENRGDEEGEMGDNLTIIDLGTELAVYSISDGGGTYSHHCVWLRNVSQFYGLKCFGYGANGRLGNGDKNNRGDNEGEMGDNLEIIIAYQRMFVHHLLMHYLCVLQWVPWQEMLKML